MTYTRGVPNANSRGQDSQPILLANTNAADDIFGIDHYKYSDNSNDRGKHAAIRLKDQTADGDPTTLSDEYAIYSKQDAGDLEIFAREPSNGTVKQITKDGFLNTGVVPVAAANFDNSLVLASGFNVASVTTSGTGKFQINFTTPLSDNNYSWSIQVMSAANPPLYGGPQPSATYSDSVNTNYFRVQFSNVTNGNPAAILRATVIIYKYL